jgi:hypothetical protein
LHTLTAHYATNAANNQQNNVVQHLGKRLVNWSHALDRLNHKGKAIQHEDNDTSEDDCYD